MEKGKIIFFNGVSSSGKTTLAKILQEKLSEPCFLLNLDKFADMMRLPENFYADGRYDWSQMEIKISSAFNQTIKIFSDMGFHTIVDRVIFPHECIELFHEYPVLFILVTCPLEELRRREKERGDRIIGQAEEQLAELLMPNDNYDIIVDTHNNTLEECTNKITDMLNYPEKFTAFKNLRVHRTNKQFLASYYSGHNT